MECCSFPICKTQQSLTDWELEFSCSLCRTKYYCSLQCCNLDWDLYHKNDCSGRLSHFLSEVSSKTSLPESKPDSVVPIKKKKTIEDYEIVAPSDNKYTGLGTGSFGEVKLVRDKEKPEDLYALKIINKKILKAYSSPEVIRREIKIHKKLEHPHIVKLHKWFEDKDNVYMVMEYAEKGTLFSYLRDKKKLTEKEAFVYFFQTALGLNYLHNKGILHRDLKPENLLLDSKKNVKLCDFGWSAEDVGQRNTFCGTIDYMAPEMIKKEPHNSSIDIWSLGILLYELLHGATPFASSTMHEKFQKIIANEVTYGDISPEALDLISSILNSDPSKRPSMKEIFSHPWLARHEQEFNISILEYTEAGSQPTARENNIVKPPLTPTFHRNINFEKSESTSHRESLQTADSFSTPRRGSALQDRDSNCSIESRHLFERDIEDRSSVMSEKLEWSNDLQEKIKSAGPKLKYKKLKLELVKEEEESPEKLRKDVYGNFEADEVQTINWQQNDFSQPTALSPLINRNRPLTDTNRGNISPMNLENEYGKGTKNKENCSPLNPKQKQKSRLNSPGFPDENSLAYTENIFDQENSPVKVAPKRERKRSVFAQKQEFFNRSTNINRCKTEQSQLKGNRDVRPQNSEDKVPSINYGADYYNSVCKTEISEDSCTRINLFSGQTERDVPLSEDRFIRTNHQWGKSKDVKESSKLVNKYPFLREDQESSVKNIDESYKELRKKSKQMEDFLKSEEIDVQKIADKYSRRKRRIPEVKKDQEKGVFGFFQEFFRCFNRIGGNTDKE